jgi:putative transposase
MRPQRLAGFQYLGYQRYFLTTCTFDRRRHFTSGQVVDVAHGEFLRTATEFDFAILAYCFMPDHAHLLVEGSTDSADFRGFAALAKQRSGYAVRSLITGRLWQKGYFERVLRDEDDTFHVARYVLNNPVRAGLVASPADYPFLGSAVLAKDDLIGSCMWSGEARSVRHR